MVQVKKQSGLYSLGMLYKICRVQEAWGNLLSQQRIALSSFSPMPYQSRQSLLVPKLPRVGLDNGKGRLSFDF